MKTITEELRNGMAAIPKTEKDFHNYRIFFIFVKSVEITSNDIIAGNGRILKVYFYVSYNQGKA